MKTTAGILFVSIVIILGLIFPIAFIIGSDDASLDEYSFDDAAMTWFRDNYPGKECDSCIIEDYSITQGGNRIVYAEFFHEGVEIASAKINVDWYRENRLK